MPLCPDCLLEKELDEFYTDNSKRGHSKKCKPCFDSYSEYKKNDEKLHCNWCFGYGVCSYDGRPLGVHEVKQYYAVKDCPVCKANWKKKQRSVIDINHNPKYPW